MSLAELTGKIINDAKNNAGEIVGNAEKETKKIDGVSGEKLNELRKNAEIVVEKNMIDNKRKVVASAEQEAKLAIETMRRDVLDQAFNRALIKFANDDELYQKIMLKLLSSLPKKIDALVTVPVGEKERAKKVLTAAGLSLSIEERATTTSGIIIEGVSEEFNFSFEKLLDDKKGELELGLANILF
jgi:vacuolar-type H+-ATPase subunit E/Vma4